MNNKDNLTIERGWLFETKRNFAQRWKISISNEKCFYERYIQITSKIIGEGINFEEVSYKAQLILGKSSPLTYTSAPISDILNPMSKMLKQEIFNFGNEKLYSTLKELSNGEHLLEFLEIIELIINFYEQEKNDEIILEFNDVAFMANKSIRLVYDKGYKFYPANIEIFDKKLIDDVLEFLQNYPEAHQEFSQALKFLLENKYRVAIESTRKALEFFLKRLLKNEKSLENQIGNKKKDGELFKYLGNSIYQEIKTMLDELIKNYAKLNNEYVKHGTKEFNRYEVEFLFYLVGNFIRLLIQIEAVKKNKLSE